MDDGIGGEIKFGVLEVLGVLCVYSNLENDNVINTNRRDSQNYKNKTQLVINPNFLIAKVSMTFNWFCTVSTALIWSFITLAEG